MQIDLLCIIALCFVIVFLLGYIIGQSQKKEKKSDVNLFRDSLYELIHNNEPNKKVQSPLPIEEDKPNPNAAKLSKKDDVINHHGVGIVYRPTAEEIERIEEPDKVREGKEAVEEIFKGVPAPEI